MTIWHVVCGVGRYPAHQVVCCMCMLDKSKTWSKQDLTWIPMKNNFASYKFS